MDELSPLIQLISAIVGIAIALLIAYVPGYIAKARRTRHARTISILGFCGFLFPPLWIVAVIWACVEKEDPQYGAGARAQAKRPRGYGGAKDMNYRE